MRVSDISPGNGHYRGWNEAMLKDASRNKRSIVLGLQIIKLANRKRGSADPRMGLELSRAVISMPLLCQASLFHLFPHHDLRNVGNRILDGKRSYRGSDS